MAIKKYIGPNRLSEIFSYIKAELDKKVTAVSGKGLSSNDYTTTEKNKLAGISSGAEVNVQSDWDVDNTSSDAYILHKPTSMPASDVPSWAKQPNKPSYTFSEITSKPTTIAGYGITDAKIANGVITLGSNTITPLTQHQDISGKADKATTLAGYGIIDAKIVSGTITLGSNTITPLTQHQTVSNKGATLAWSSAVTVATIGGTDIKVSLPANPNTDTKVTSVGNHYAPAEDSTVQLDADASSSTAATWNSTSLVTGVTVKRDAKGHVTGLAVDSIKMPANPNTNTTYTLSSDGANVKLTPSSGTSTTASLNDLINGLSEGTSTPVDSDYYISQYVGGGTTTKTYHRRPMSALYAYVKGKIGISTSGSTFLRKDGTWATPTDTNTTYTLATGDSNGQIKVTPSSGSAYNVSVKGLASAAYCTADTSASNNTVAQRTSRGYIFATYFNQSSGAEIPTSSSYFIYANSDGYFRKSSIANVNSILNPYEAKLQWGGQNHTSGFGPIDAAMVPELGANRLAFIKGSAITVEYSRDSGTTWSDYGATDANKTALFSTSSNFVIGKADSTNKATANGDKYQLRITIDTPTAGLYTYLNKFVLLISTSGSSSCTCQIQAQLRGTSTMTNITDPISIGGWSGYNVINSGFTAGNSHDGQYNKIRFLFKANGGNTNYNGLCILKIRAYGGVGWSVPSTMAGSGLLFAYDASQNATFPAAVNATQFNGSLAWSNVSSKPTTLAGYGITDAKIANGTITLGSNTITPLTSITSSQVTTALGYTPYNSTNPNGYITSSGSCASATTASKLGSSTVGSASNPIYLSSGTAIACNYPSSGSWFKGIPSISSAGVMEIGKYIDFHSTDAATTDYDARITASTSGLTLSGTTSGTFSGGVTIGDGTNTLIFRTNSTYKSGIYYSTPGKEAVVFANINNPTSWIFANTDPTNRTSWNSLVPALQIRDNKVAINQLYDVYTQVYTLDVNGSARATSIYSDGDIYSSGIIYGQVVKSQYSYPAIYFEETNSDGSPGTYSHEVILHKTHCGTDIGPSTYYDLYLPEENGTLATKEWVGHRVKEVYISVTLSSSGYTDVNITSAAKENVLKVISLGAWGTRNVANFGVVNGNASSFVIAIRVYNGSNLVTSGSCGMHVYYIPA